MKNKFDKNTLLLLIYPLFIIGYSLSRGFYSLKAVLILFVFLASLLLYFTNVYKNFEKYYVNKKLILKLIIVISLFLSLYHYGVYYFEDNISGLVSLFLISVALIFTILIKNYTKFILIFLSIFAILGLKIILDNPLPRIDIFYFLTEGVKGLIRGQNPYSLEFTKIPQYYFYHNNQANFYSYFPGMLFITLPGVLLFNDPRFILLVCILGTAYVMFKYYKQPEIALIFLFNPLSLFILEQSWTEPVIILLLTLILYFFRQKNYTKLAVTFGFLLATKQYAILFLPIVWFMLSGRLKIWLYTVITTIIIVVPFLFWNFQDFLKDTIFLQFKFPIRYDGLTFTSFLHWETAININNSLNVVIWIISFITLFVLKKNKDLPQTLFANFIFIFIFFFFNKWSFANYYYLLSSFLLLFLLNNNSKGEDI